MAETCVKPLSGSEDKICLNHDAGYLVGPQWEVEFYIWINKGKVWQTGKTKGAWFLT